jgi:hypothetical protein
MIRLLDFRLLVVILTPLFTLYFSGYNFVLMRLSILMIILYLFFLKLNLSKIRVFFLSILSISLFYLIPLILSDPIKAVFVLSFFVVLFLLDNLFEELLSSKTKKTYKLIYYIVIGFSFLLFLFFKWERFSGFSSSGTTYSTYVLCLFVGFLYFEKNRNILILISILTLILVVLSETRTSLILFIAILIIRTTSKVVSNKLNLLFYLSIISALMYYPAIVYFDNTDLLNRYEGGVDYSKITRISMFNNQIEALKNSDIVNFLFGNGIGENLKIGGGYANYSVDQHNDFFTLLYDFGFIFFILFFFGIKKLINTPFSLSVFLVYIFSFYHNMIFDLFIITILFLSSKHYQTKEKIVDVIR